MLINPTEELRAELLGSFLTFTEVFYSLRTGRDFLVSQPAGRESHIITICRALTEVADGKCTHLNINIPPRYGKTELLIHYAAWILARWPDSNFLYVSYSHELAALQTQTIREIINLSAYRKLFGVEISGDTKAKDNFKTTAGGAVFAAGTGGTITGRGAGIKGSLLPKGGVLIDDSIKPDEAGSETVRTRIIDWFYNTLQSRLNSRATPLINNGQRTNEEDLTAHLMEDKKFKNVIIPALDEHNNALDPRMHTREELLKMKAQNPYVFAAQYQQNPQPAGGGIYQQQWFIKLAQEPNIICSFITVDTAETTKKYNDATVFSFWGIYRINDHLEEIDQYALHCIDCREIRVEPRDLEMEFLDFYTSCCRYKVKPKFAAIEKKSCGTTLLSVIDGMRGITVLPIEKNKFNGIKTPTGIAYSKTDRFLACQPYVAKKLISLPMHGAHTHMFIEHMRKITANNSHAHDDIADTMCDAIQIGLIDKNPLLYNKADFYTDDQSRIMSQVYQQQSHIQQLRSAAYGHKGR